MERIGEDPNIAPERVAVARAISDGECCRGHDRGAAAGGVHMRDDEKRAGEGEPARIVGDPRRAEGTRGGAPHNVHASRANPQRLYSHQLETWHRNVV